MEAQEGEGDEEDALEKAAARMEAMDVGTDSMASISSRYDKRHISSTDMYNNAVGKESAQTLLSKMAT